MITITLNKLRKFSPCQESWKKFLTYKGKTQADDEEFPIIEILDNNGLQDCIWALRVCPLYAMLFARACAMRANEYAANAVNAANATADANAVYAAYATIEAAVYAAYAVRASNAAHAAAYAIRAADANAVYAVRAAEQAWQAEFLRKLLT